MPIRANMTLAVKRLMRDVAARLPELAHVRPSRVLVLAGEARGTSRATIRPATMGPGHDGEGRRRHFIRVRGRRMLYVVTLRPLWFAASTPEERVSTILHELYHASTRFDGSLHHGRRHAKLPRAAYDREVRALLARYLEVAPQDVLAPFAAEGIVRVKMWLRVPRASERDGPRELDVDEHLMHGFMPLRTRATKAGRRRKTKVPARRLRGHDEEEGA